MKEKPIIFGADSVRAILSGAKTQTRRVVQFGCLAHSCIVSIVDGEILTEKGNKYEARQPFKVGQRLWVKESFRSDSEGGGSDREIYEYKADGIQSPKWSSPLFMPRNASRITLEVTEVRVERLQEISNEDVAAEGVKNDDEGFVGHWDKINGKKHPWSSSPWVWVITFKRLTPC